MAHDRPATSENTNTRTGLRRLIAVASIAVVFGVLVLWGFSGTVTDAACTVCHSRTESRVDAHEQVRCYRCHSTPRVDAILGMKVREALMLGSALAGREATGTPTTPARQACSSCHDDVLMGTIERGGIRINHGICAGPPQACTDCHWGVGHGSAARPGRGIAMDRCMECHDSVNASWSCSTCHLDSGHADRPSVGSWAITHGPKWQSAHGMGDLRTCGACHDRDLCKRCHGVGLPHPGGYVSGKHGEEAKPDTAVCVGCHQQSFCDDCHGIEMPHPSEFLPTHSTIVGKQGEAVCERCHVLDDCDLCHVSHVHPGHP